MEGRGSCAANVPGAHMKHPDCLVCKKEIQGSAYAFNGSLGGRNRLSGWLCEKDYVEEMKKRGMRFS